MRIFSLPLGFAYKQSSEEASDVHDAVWITNPYSSPEDDANPALAVSGHETEEDVPTPLQSGSARNMNDEKPSVLLVDENDEASAATGRAGDDEHRSGAHEGSGGGLRVPGLSNRRTRLSL